ncbi:DMT (drug/metabolite transporter) superfamily permease [Candidatus Nitrosoglobus terrae]|uniref:DMT (Drug/metabolite transporter) superfamily permease n=2 Tax=Candidatus Nitrosoglobus terrae TaxID=1630141 RepID=A0A1Q2SK05_9GAMM|nr:DMT (drug/metabolite transporter) superfamily permease [Candidatus Nitrosoglobus terrae]
MLGLIAVIGFGLTLPVTRLVVVYLDPIFISSGRAVIAATIAGLWLLLTKEIIPSKKQILQLIIVALGVVIGFPILSAWAMKTVPASHGGVVLGIQPLITATVGAKIGKEQPSLGFWLSSILGATLVISYVFLQEVGNLLWGDIALLGAAIAAAIGYAVGGILAREIGGWNVICWALVLSLPIILVPSIVTAPEEIYKLPINIWVSFLYLALVSQLFALFFWNKSLALGGVARVSQTLLIQPFITIAASQILIGEEINTTTVIFAWLVVTTVAISRRMPIYENKNATNINSN